MKRLKKALSIFLLLGLFSPAFAQQRDVVSVQSSGYIPGYVEPMFMEPVSFVYKYLCYSYDKDTQDLTLFYLEPSAVFPINESVEAVYDESDGTLKLSVVSTCNPDDPVPTTPIHRLWHAVIANVPKDAARIMVDIVVEKIPRNQKIQERGEVWDIPVSFEMQPEGVKFKN